MSEQFESPQSLDIALKPVHVLATYVACKRSWEKSGCSKLCFLVFRLLLQILYFVLDVTIHNNQRGDHLVFNASDSPVACWLLAFLWPLVLIPILELIKRREIRQVFGALTIEATLDNRGPEGRTDPSRAL